MEGRGRLGARNWDLCENSKHSGKMLKSLSGVPVPTAAAAAYAHQETTSLKMSSSYPLRDSITGEHSSRAATMNLAWIPERHYMTHSKCIDHPEANPVSLQMMEVQSDDRMHADDKMANSPPTPDARNQQHLSSKKPGRRPTSKVLRPKEPKKKKLSSPSKKKGGSSSSIGRREKKNQDSILMAIELDLSRVPVPVCSCTGVPRQCYRWGSGGWQSSCCTMTISEYPLPMSPSRPGVRRAGRKMSIGAYGKLLQRLAAEGCDLSCAVDLKDHWARHGTNKFVTIR